MIPWQHSLEGAHILTGQLRSAAEERLWLVAERLGEGRACPAALFGLSRENLQCQHRLWRGSTETALHLSSTAARAANVIRGHWKIESTFHYSCDITKGEYSL